MNGKDFFAHQRQIETPSGTIGYVEQGSGPVALFVHGVLLNGYLWRHQLAQRATQGAASPWICWRTAIPKYPPLRMFR